MDPGVLLVLLAAAIALVILCAGSGAATAQMGGLFRHPDLGWPDGVQEDDDAHWSWTAASRADAAVPGDTTRVHPVVRRR
jgi:hypothetical protein